MALITVPITPEMRNTREKRSWYIEDIYTGPNGKGQIVPVKDEMVWSWTEGLLRVMHVDEVSNLSTLVAYNFSNLNGGCVIEDSLLGIGFGTATQAHRVYINTTTVPHTMTFDTRLRSYGSRTSYCKVFYNDKVTNQGHVVSAIFNSSNVQVSENIPMELSLINNSTNYTIKVPATAWCNESIPDGETLSVVFYATDGSVLGSSPVIVKHSNFVRTIDQNAKYITNIELISPYTSSTDSTLLEYPINMTIQSGSLIGRVYYSDGSPPLDLPVDNTRFSLHGITNFIASKVGAETNLVLSYKMSAEEYAYSTNQPLPERTITKAYRVRTVEAVNRYTVKIYTVPVWTGGSVDAWSLTYYLYDLDRQVIHEVTPYIEYQVGAPTFNGKLYGIPQEVRIAMNLDSLGSSYQWYRHPEMFTVTLHQRGGQSNPTNFFTLAYTNTMNYGSNLFANASSIVSGNATIFTLDLANGCTNITDWLNKHYWVLEPLVYDVVETQAPSPTHVRVKIGTQFNREIEITNILEPITNITNTLSAGQTVRLEYVRKGGNLEQELAIGSLNVKMA